MTKTVPVPDHDPLRIGTPRREAKVWGKAGSAAKSLASPGCHHRDRHRATALEHLCDPSGNVGEVLPAAEIMNRLAGEALEALAAACRR